MEFIDLKKQYQLMRANIDERISKVLKHSQFIMGPEVVELETRLAQYIGVKHCLTVANCTDALLIALMALNIGSGDEVITTPFNFAATIEVILFMGAKPVFVDIDPNTYNLDPSLLEQAITSKTKAIIPVSLYGQCADFDPINAIANLHSVPVIEDAGQSFGATYKGRYSGSLSTVGCTSFFPSKPLGCYGDGGACFTNDDNIAANIRKIRNHGQESRYHHITLGFNSRLDTIQAAVLLAKLDVFAEELKLRTKVAGKYDLKLPEGAVIPFIEPHNASVYAQYTIQVENRDAVRKALQEQQIPTAVHYPTPLHKQPVLAKLGHSKHSLQTAEQAAEKVLSLPFHPYLQEHEVETILLAIERALA